MTDDRACSHIPTDLEIYQRGNDLGNYLVAGFWEEVRYGTLKQLQQIADTPEADMNENSNLYINARNLINANIRYLEHASLTNLYLSYRKIKKSNIQPDMDYQLLLFLFSDDEKMTEFLNGISAEAGINVFLYCALINPISFTSNLLVAIFLIVKTYLMTIAN